ncbi:ATP:cob(I)alamin adenosyltransferase [Balneicella halophila]|uniref:Corrinoid adenosyltransferase n=1 Tax=Balneicella halophila TaxID=1537566 RepID=A0A7L4UNS9_BALHA|nr:cob(I)yrinic acid a,c-diamide adenosyltransferase [Balneicella halophila]PVX50684.1 ATP:cob(I)alamin adenosyltransferase [Balneicella halophila]
MAIYTKTGDKGKTGIHGGMRVDKDDIRIEANGTADELNSIIGIVRAHLNTEHDWQPFLYRIQKEMMVAMSIIATPSENIKKNPNTFDESLISDSEKMIDELNEKMGGSRDFLLPGGNLVSSNLHFARTVARRCERRLWTLHKKDELPNYILIFFNRLSDLFFVMARYELFVNEENEEVWKAFKYKTRKK